MVLFIMYFCLIVSFLLLIYFQEYFVFLQLLAVHTNQLPKLMQSVIAMLPEIHPHFSTQQQQALSVTSVWTQFLSTILAHCKKVIVAHAHPTPMHIDTPLAEKKEEKVVDEKEKAKEIEDKELEAVAGKCCTYAQTGNNYTEQHWYFCYTCKLQGSNGCCTVCARICHRGHDVGYSRFSRFFCDCGAATTSTCKALKPVKYKPSQPTTQGREQARSAKKPARTPHVLRMVEEASEAQTPGTQEGLPVAAPLPQPIIASLLGVVSKESLVDTLFPVLSKLLEILKVNPLPSPSFLKYISSLFYVSLSVLKIFLQQGQTEQQPVEEAPVKKDLFSEDKKLDFVADFLHLKRSIKPGAFDVKMV